jgi:hypothetical protein
MTCTTLTPDTAAANAGRSDWLAGLLRRVARRVERAATLHARRKARRMTEAELARLPESVRAELGIALPEARASAGPSPLLQGLAGPSQYWGVLDAAGRR